MFGIKNILLPVLNKLNTNQVGFVNAGEIINEISPAVGHDAGGRTRVSQLTTLLDGKILGEDDTELFENVGTGTFTFENNTALMEVTVGQYCIRQSTRFNPYFSGKSQVVEETFEDFHLEDGLIKRVGYFSSNAVAPYDSNYDGFWFESNGVDNKYYVKAYRNGVETVNNDVTTYFSSYNSENFTVSLSDFLWLGGATLRNFIKNTDGFDIVSLMDFAGQQQGTFILSPNQPVRYEIRSTTGVGSLRYICCQVATEGSLSESGKTKAVYNDSNVTTNNTSTTYALLGIKKRATFRDTAVQIIEMGVVNTSQNDSGMLLLLKNPTLSASLTYSNNGKIDSAQATNQTVSANGYVVSATPAGLLGSSNVMKENFLSFLSSKIDNTMDEYILAYRPASSNQSVRGVINIKEF